MREIVHPYLSSISCWWRRTCLTLHCLYGNSVCRPWLLLWPLLPNVRTAGHYVLLVMIIFFISSLISFFLFFSTFPIGRSPRNFTTWSEMGVILKIRSQNLKYGGTKRPKFCTISDNLRLCWRISPDRSQMLTVRKMAFCKFTIFPALDDVILWWTLVDER